MASAQAQGAGRAVVLASDHTAMSAQVLAGSVVAQGETEAVITATGGSTFFGKTVTLLSEPEEVGHLRKVLLSFSPLLFHSEQSVEACACRCTLPDLAEQQKCFFWSMTGACIPIAARLAHGEPSRQARELSMRGHLRYEVECPSAAQGETESEGMTVCIGLKQGELGHRLCGSHWSGHHPGVSAGPWGLSGLLCRHCICHPGVLCARRHACRDYNSLGCGRKGNGQAEGHREQVSPLPRCLP